MWAETRIRSVREAHPRVAHRIRQRGVLATAIWDPHLIPLSITIKAKKCMQRVLSNITFSFYYSTAHKKIRDSAHRHSEKRHNFPSGTPWDSRRTHRKTKKNLFLFSSPLWVSDPAAPRPPRDG
ncbi:hypothetical protein MRV_0005 [Murine roseolovirus]|uniref:Uncharacterized protein n=1 Tax=Murid betaherpesvirus 3 TaxID=2560603 RepID=A0A1P8VIN3_9BETA|nr:hypothetical protein MRV_0005 [Murine roseolovirus]APZ76216.1 hypothetical protein MRV_0005 [Murid betaherpesvirus 3]